MRMLSFLPCLRSGCLALAALWLVPDCLSQPLSDGRWETSAGPDWPSRPALYAHRGASAQRPEHTLAAYQQAIDDGADLIEPDLVITKDGVLVARHENAIAILKADGSVQEATTNVAELAEFANRKRTKQIDGVALTGWFVEDFTLAELKTLRARERIPAIRPANSRYNDQFEIPTLQEVIDLARANSLRLGRTIGMVPETKHPSYFQSIGLPLEGPLLEVLARNGLNQAAAPVLIQSFEVTNLQALHQRTPVRLVQLVSPDERPYDWVLRGAADTRSAADLVSPAGLAAIKRYADVIAPHKSQVRPVQDGKLGPATSLVADAHAAGLQVVIWTLRPENEFLPASLRGKPKQDARARGDLQSEIWAYLDAGVDGIFSDDSAAARAAISAYHQR